MAYPREPPMFRPHRLGLPQAPHRQLYLSDLKNSRFNPNITSLSCEGSRLKIKVSLCYYKPEDVKVEIQDNFVVIEANHEERKEKRCFVSRGFKRRVNLPAQAIVDEVNGKWTPNGWLSVYVPLMPPTGAPPAYSTTGGQPPHQSGDKATKPQQVQSVPIRIANY